jgi:uncharacterized protein YfiM (DUF2279 family)
MLGVCGRIFAARAPLLQAGVSEWEPRPRSDGLGVCGRIFAAGAPLLQAGVTLWEPRPRGDGWGLRAHFRGEGAAATGRGDFVGAPPSGRWLGVCGRIFAARAPLLQAGVTLWEPRPRGDGWGLRAHFRGEGAAATGRGDFVGAPPSGRWLGVCGRIFAARAPLLQAGVTLWEPRPRGDGWVLRAHFRSEGAAAAPGQAGLALGARPIR